MTNDACMTTRMSGPGFLLGTAWAVAWAGALEGLTTVLLGTIHNKNLFVVACMLLFASYPTVACLISRHAPYPGSGHVGKRFLGMVSAVVLSIISGAVSMGLAALFVLISVLLLPLPVVTHPYKVGVVLCIYFTALLHAMMFAVSAPMVSSLVGRVSGLHGGGPSPGQMEAGLLIAFLVHIAAAACLPYAYLEFVNIMPLITGVGCFLGTMAFMLAAPVAVDDRVGVSAWTTAATGSISACGMACLFLLALGLVR